jgi:hypothetical protein
MTAPPLPLWRPTNEDCGLVDRRTLPKAEANGIGVVHDSFGIRHGGDFSVRLQEWRRSTTGDATCHNRTCIALSTQEARGALFEECCDTLACIMGWDNAGESGFLNRQPVVDRRIHAAMDRRQGGGKCERRL